MRYVCHLLDANSCVVMNISGHFVRTGLGWSFLGACIYCIRALLQSYLDQASTVASAMSVYGEAGSKQISANQPDPFSDRFAKIIPTAGKITGELPRIQLYGFIALHTCVLINFQLFLHLYLLSLLLHTFAEEEFRFILVLDKVVLML